MSVTLFNLFYFYFYNNSVYIDEIEKLSLYMSVFKEAEHPRRKKKGKNSNYNKMRLPVTSKPQVPIIKPALPKYPTSLE